MVTMQLHNNYVSTYIRTLCMLPWISTAVLYMYITVCVLYNYVPVYHNIHVHLTKDIYYCENVTTLIFIL